MSINSVRSCVRLIVKGLGGPKFFLPHFLCEAVGVHEAVWVASLLGKGIEVHGAPETRQELERLFMGEWGGRAPLSTQDAQQWVDTLLAKAKETLDAKLAERQKRKLARLTKTVENRVQYRYTSVFQFYNKNGLEDQNWSEGWRWHFSREVRGVGLMDLVTGMREITTLPLIVELVAPEGEEWVAAKAWEKALQGIAATGYACSKQKLLWNRNSWGFKSAVKLFPNAVDFNAYNHGLNAPVVPGGYMPDCEVRILSLKDHLGQSLESDGSGRIHPLHPLYAQMGRATPHYPIQIRWFNDHNSFAKGILVPDDRCVDESGKPEIWLDWLQVKGANKAQAKKARGLDRSVVTKGWMGVIQVWDQPSKIDWSFEQLENIQTNPETKRIVGEQVRRAMMIMERGGIMGLAERVARDSKVAMMVLKVIAAMQAAGLDVNPLQFPLMKSQILDRLGKQLWWISQGAGLQMDRYVAVQDATVKPGCCVVKDLPVGQKVAGMRYPVVLSQGLVTLTVQAPEPHQLVQGDITPYTIYLNPQDLTGCLMGDDDGDTVGISTDPDILTLWGQLIDHQRYAIEPKGEPIFLDPQSPEGLQYLAKDHRDDVGKLTIMRTKLLAVGDLRGAVAISCLVQEAIDRAKRVVVWTDWREAVNLNTWEEVQGTLHYRGPKLTGDLPIQDIAKWVNGRVYKFGSVEKGKKASVIAWRTQFTKSGSGQAAKRVNPQTWQFCRDAGNWSGGNLVHHASDTALECWKGMEQRFLPNPDATQDLSRLLRMALDTVEVTVEGQETPERYYPDMTWDQYSQYRQQWGLNNFRGSFKTCMAKKAEADKLMAIDQLIEERADEMKAMQEEVGELEMVARMELMWRMECQGDPNEGVPGNINSALYSICYAGSPLLSWLGIEQPKDGCQFLTTARVKAIMGRCLNTPEPIQTLMGILNTSTKHGEEIKDQEGEPVPGWACPDCVDRLTLHLVRSIRQAKDSGQATQAKELRSQLQGSIG
jgi:hypothetical protein